MPTSIHLLTGPPGPGLTAGLLCEYVKALNEPGSALWLSPSDRAADEIVRLLAASGRPILQPNVYSIGAFVDAVLQRVAPAAASSISTTRRVVLDEVASELARQGRIPFFRRVAETRGFLEGAAGFLDELESASVTPDQFRAVDCGPRAAKLGACAELYAAAVARGGEPRSRVASATAVVENEPPSPFDAIRSVFVGGFTTLTPAESRLVTALARRSAVWISLPEDTGDRPGTFVGVDATRRTLADLGRLELASRPETTVTDRPAGLAR